MSEYFSESYGQAAEKFLAAAQGKGDLKFYQDAGTPYQVPVISIGDGADKIVINTGIHGLEGFSGSAALVFWLKTGAEFLRRKNSQTVLIHAINGFGMDHGLRENAGNVDLNRNFRNWNLAPAHNPQYAKAHRLLVSQPGRDKYEKLLHFHRAHKKDGGWRGISRGQYEFPDGIFYGGTEPQPEYKIVRQIYDDVMRGAKSLLSIGLHTGLGDYKLPTLLVSHPSRHPNAQFFQQKFEPALVVEPDEGAAAAALNGDLVDWLEDRYQGISVQTADLEIGTGTNKGLSPVLKRMDQGDARWEIANKGKISQKTFNNLREDWYPKSANWRKHALAAYDILAMKLANLR